MDNFEILKTIINDDLNSNEYNVILLKGEWGIGKTHLWTEISKTINDKEVKYCSLFGLKAKSEILTSLVFGNKDNIDDVKTVFDSIIPGIMNATSKQSGINSIGGALFGTGKIFQNIYENKILNNKIIVLDDIERKDKSLEMNVLLGLVNELKQKQNKIILICNENEIISKYDDKIIWQQFKEKIIDREISLNITTSKIVDLLKTEDNMLIMDELLNLNIKNIRIAELITKRVMVLEKKLNFSHFFNKEVIRNAVIMHYLYLVNFENLDSNKLIEFLQDYNELEKMFKLTSDYKERIDSLTSTEEEKKLDNLMDFLKNKNYYVDNINNIIIEDLKNGYLNENDLDKYILENKFKIIKKENDILIKNFINSFLFNFNQQEINQGLTTYLEKEYDNYIYVYNLWGFLEKSKNEYASQYLQKFKLNFYENLAIRNENNNLANLLTKEDWKTFKKKKEAILPPLPTLINLIEEINNNLFLRDEEKIMNSFSQVDIKKELLVLSEKNLKKVFYFSQKHKQNKKYEKYMKNFYSVLEDWGKNSNPDNKRMKEIAIIFTA